MDSTHFIFQPVFISFHRSNISTQILINNFLIIQINIPVLTILFKNKIKLEKQLNK